MKKVDCPTYAYELRRVVVDDFYEDPELIRHWALTAAYYRPPDETIWRTRSKLFRHDVKERLARSWGRRLSRQHWGNSFNGTFFIACDKGRYRTNPFIHYDAPVSFITVIVFLTPGDFNDAGTTFYRHRTTNLLGAPDRRTLRRMKTTLPDFEEMIWKDGRKKAAWDAVDQSAYRYNRAVFFPAGVFHAATRTFGASLKRGRLWQSFHFALDAGHSSD